MNHSTKGLIEGLKSGFLFISLWPFNLDKMVMVKRKRIVSSLWLCRLEKIKQSIPFLIEWKQRISLL